MNCPTLTLKGLGRAGEKEDEVCIWDCGSPLYDSYELVSLNHIIDRHLMAFPNSSHEYPSKHIITRFTHHHLLPIPDKSKGSFIRKNNQERGKRNNKITRGLAGFVVYLLSFFRK
ncbi:hypothetical protein VNO78_25136 [Psophocarpus tetragonolobus]|uniref:Uncharacterized protein n=1 Tax=Psophocarpus tetragonolobus TaxID=3891 RepID=A0AAN9S6B6_PSOTE